MMVSMRSDPVNSIRKTVYREKVIALYAEKLEPGEAKTGAVQDDSKGRLATFWVFVVNKAGTVDGRPLLRWQPNKKAADLPMMGNRRPVFG
jgi:hypothetical protein